MPYRGGAFHKQESEMKVPKPKEPPIHEQRFLERVRGLVATSNRAREEAEQYAQKIEDPDLKAEAQRLLDL